VAGGSKCPRYGITVCTWAQGHPFAPVLKVVYFLEIIRLATGLY